MIRKLLVLAGLLAASCAAAKSEWITMHTESFRVYSSASERSTREALNRLERVRGFFVQFTGIEPDKSAPVSVVLFGSEKEYLPYRFNAFAVAYYSNHSDRDFIVLGKPGEQSMETAAHEYTHLVYQHAGYRLPPWLNEGLAELYSNIQSMGDYTGFGDAIPGRVLALRDGTWVPLQTILNADQQSPYYTDPKLADRLYNAGWALVHMLATTEPYRQKFSVLVEAINNGTPSVTALEAVYGMPLATLESALKSYIHGNNFNMLKVKIRLAASEKLAGQPADPFEVRQVQAELLMGLDNKQQEARSLFETLSREAPDRPEPMANLGYLSWRAGDPDAAAEQFATAIKLGNRSPRLLLDFARLAGSDSPKSATTALQFLLELEPKNLDGRLLLANLLMRQDQFAEAYQLTKAVTSVRTAEQRDSLLYMRAYAALRLGNREDARKLAEELAKVATSEDLRDRAEDMLRMSGQR